MGDMRMKNIKSGNSVGLATLFKMISKITITGSLCATVGVTDVLAESIHPTNGKASFFQ